MKKKIRIIVFLLVLIGVVGSVGIYGINEHNKDLENGRVFELNQKIKSHFNKYVITNKKTNLYQYSNNKYSKVGELAKNVELTLNIETEKDGNEYFLIDGFDNTYYIFYKDVDKIDNLTEISTRYKSYIPFNENIVTSELTKFYDNGQVIYTFNKSLELPILIKENDYYYVEYNNRLLAVKKTSVKEVIKANNSDKKAITTMPVVTLHSVYDEQTRSKCTNSEICHSYEEAEVYFKYIHDNNVFTPTMSEFNQFMDGNLRLPKSMLVTADDGWLMENIILLMEEYHVNGTIFLITAWYNVPKEDYQYVEFQSHGHDLHNTGVCAGGQGGGIRCLSRETILEDLSKSKTLLGDSTIAFCFPFYEYNDYAISLVKEAGFKLAFVGGNTNAVVGQNKYTIPRYTLITATTVDDLAWILSR